MWTKYISYSDLTELQIQGPLKWGLVYWIHLPFEAEILIKSRLFYFINVYLAVLALESIILSNITSNVKNVLLYKCLLGSIGFRVNYPFKHNFKCEKKTWVKPGHCTESELVSDL